MHARSARRWRLFGVAAATVGGLLALTACTGGTQPGTQPPSSPPVSPCGRAIQAFAKAWSAGGKHGLGKVVDRPRAADAAISSYDAALTVTGSAVVPTGPVAPSAGRCHQAADVTLRLTGAEPWTYRTTIRARQTSSGWRAVWSPQTFYPRLTASTTLRLTRTLPPRAPILDRGGSPITPLRPIDRVGVVPKKVRPQTYPDLARLLSIDPTSLHQQVQAAQPDWFVPVIDLRRSAYLPLRSRLLAVPGVLVDPGTRALAPTATWARALLGAVEPATAATLASAGPLAAPTDEVGAGGLQQAFQQRLAGAPGLRIALVSKSTGTVRRVVLSRAPVPGRPLPTTLSSTAQDVVERVLASATATTAAVLVQSSTGQVLAVGNAPGPTSYDTALVGEYAPGSTFKTVSATALLSEGKLTPASRVACPPHVLVGGRSFRNAELGLPPHLTFAQAYAVSCNTAFVPQAERLDADALPKAAALLGLTADWKLGVAGFSGSVPATSDLVTRAADMIGQGTILVSPLAMAMVAATADSGVARTPTLLPTVDPGRRLDRLPGPLTRDLHQLMRLVVTSGTGTGVNLPGLPVYAKTGTPQYQVGGGSKTATNAWMIAFRGDVALAVFVANGSSGADAAGPVVRAILSGLPAAIYHRGGGG
ncbi:MAG TPA: penicillin-binding transpeptidase domain-containing protein [Nocardioidaceae bacterium]|nr:penicillin-binding transpeptidase domain-containing protein [Nocardioidaceae bacterium]